MNARHAADPPTEQAGDGADAGALPIRIMRGDPTPEELAAVTAVLTALAQESADDAVLDSAHSESAWQRSVRATPSTPHPGPGVWRSFSG